MGLSKTQMRDVIENGGTVLHSRGLITKVEQLSKIGGTEAEKQSEIEALKARLAELESGKSDEKPTGESAENDTEKDSGKEKSSEALDDSEDELKRHTRQELLMKAQADGIEVGESDTKAEIIKKILAKGK